jgi:hypothetical protein
MTSQPSLQSFSGAVLYSQHVQTPLTTQASMLILAQMALWQTWTMQTAQQLMTLHVAW